MSEETRAREGKEGQFQLFRLFEHLKKIVHSWYGQI